MFHVPWYNSNAGHFKEAERHRAALERTLYDAGVDVVLNGHVHSYERNRPDARRRARPVRRRASRRRRRRELRGTLRRRLARRTAGVERVPRGLFRRGSVGDSQRDARDVGMEKDDVRRSGGNQRRPGETRYAPTGDHGEECQSVGDVSAQAMRAVDRAVFVRDVEACPNRRGGAGGSGRRKPSPNDGGERDDAGRPDGDERRRRRDALRRFAWIATSAALVRALTLLRRERTEMNAARAAAC